MVWTAFQIVFPTTPTPTTLPSINHSLKRHFSTVNTRFWGEIETPWPHIPFKHWILCFTQMFAWEHSIQIVWKLSIFIMVRVSYQQLRCRIWGECEWYMQVYLNYGVLTRTYKSYAFCSQPTSNKSLWIGRVKICLGNLKSHIVHVALFVN